MHHWPDRSRLIKYFNEQTYSLIKRIQGEMAIHSQQINKDPLVQKKVKTDNAESPNTDDQRMRHAMLFHYMY